MGMYSYVKEDNIRIINKSGLKLYVCKCFNGELYDGNLKGSVMAFIKQEYQEESKLDMKTDFLSNTLEIDSWKIIQYWYKDFTLMLRDLSAFLDGWIMLEYETGEEFARISFDGDETKIDIGVMNWGSVTTADLYNDKRNGFNGTVIPDEAELVKRARLLSQV